VPDAILLPNQQFCCPTNSVKAIKAKLSVKSHRYILLYSTITSFIPGLPLQISEQTRNCNVNSANFSKAESLSVIFQRNHSLSLSLTQYFPAEPGLTGSRPLLSISNDCYLSILTGHAKTLHILFKTIPDDHFVGFPESTSSSIT